jgi:phage I-like protein
MRAEMRTKIASLNMKTGRIRINPMIKGETRERILRHEKEFLRRRRSGWSFTRSVMEARKVEHRGMTKHQIKVYEGRIGAMTRWHLKRLRMGV